MSMEAESFLDGLLPWNYFSLSVRTAQKHFQVNGPPMLNASSRHEKRKGIELHLIKWLKMYKR
jgi:hypothetical protein